MSAQSPRWRRWLVWLGVLGLVVVVMASIGSGGRGGRPLDPESTARDGTRAIFDVLRELGVDVVVDTALAERTGITVLLDDRLADHQREALEAWVRDGGTLIVADPFSPLAPELLGTGNIGFTEPTITPECDDPAVSGVERVAVDQSYVYEPSGAPSQCFPRAGGHWMVRTPTGDGQVVALGGAYSLTNDLIRNADTAVLAVALMTPEDGRALTVLEPETITIGGDETLFDLLPDGVRTLFVQLPLAWLALVWWRGRRDGKLELDHPPVTLEASESTVAHGRLMRRAGLSAQAAEIITGEVTDRLVRRAAVSADMPVDQAVAVAAARTAVDAAALGQILRAPPPQDDADLVRLAGLAATVLDQIDIPVGVPGSPTGPAAPGDPPDRPALPSPTATRSPQ